MTKLPSIFICYRREDSAGYAGRIYDRLSLQFNPDQIFMDVDSIEPGLDFVEVIESAVSACDVMIVIIGKQWLKSDDSHGNRRLDNPEDFVRLEITTAIDRNIRLIPVLVQGVAMPRSSDLPEALGKLARRHALEISDARWQHDIGKLTKTLEGVLTASNSKLANVLAVPHLEAQHQPESTPSNVPAKRTSAPEQPPHRLSSVQNWGRANVAALPVEVSDEVERKQHHEARRFARLLISELKLFSEQKLKLGRRESNIYERLRNDIDRSREMYDKRVAKSVAARYDYFHHELINVLAEGNPAKMGKNYPGIRRLT